MNAWILLRGLTREARHWGAFPEVLAARCPHVPIVAIDLPGNGKLNNEPSPPDVATMAAACRARARALGLAPPFGVVAMSLGAMVTAQWAHDTPEELAAAVLVNTSLRPHSPFHHRLQAAAWPGLLRVALTRDARRREQAVWSLTSRRPEADRDATVAAWSAIHQDRPVATINGLRQLWAAARYRAPAHAPEVPMLMLCGAGDRLVNPDCSAAIAGAWHATLRTHPWAGHDLPLDDPAWVADTALAWCDQQLSDSRP